MSSKYISGTYNAGYTLTGTYSAITIGTTGSIGGTGLLGGTATSYAIVNLGRVAASTAGASGILLRAGGTIANGSTSKTTARIVGGSGSAGNSGNQYKGGTGGIGISLSGGGSIDNAGSIAGGGGGPGRGYSGGGAGGAGIVLSDKGSIVNSGMVAGGSGGSGLGAGGAGIVLSGGGSIGNSGLIVGGGGGAGFEFTGGGGAGIVVSGGGSIGNSGKIAAGAGNNYDAIRISGGGSIGNSGLIAGRIVLSGGGGISNSGTIVGGSRGIGVYGVVGGAGIVLAGGGGIGNSGVISGGGGGGIFGSAGKGIVLSDGGSIGNWGTVAAGTDFSSTSGAAGIIMSAGGIVTNGSAGGGTALITGGIGIQALGTAGATVTNFGRIASVNGTSGTAIAFGGSGGNVLVLEHGYSFGGTITVAGPANTLELAGNAGPVNVDFDKSGVGFTNFGTAAFGPATGNNEILTISDTTALPGTISGFIDVQDVVNLTQLSPVGAAATLNASDQLVVSNGSQTVMLQLDTREDYTGIVWQTSPDVGIGTDIAPVCFCRGTLIEAVQGEVPVEELKVGDRVKTLSGSCKPIVWIGFGRSLVTHVNKMARPIIVRAGALADNVPKRDLYLTHGHALYVDGVLVPVENLVNYRSIAWDETARVVEYYHIELEEHDVLFANGAPAESYYDADNRALFHNTRKGSRPGPDKSTYAPVLQSGDIVEKVWAELFERAGGHVEDNTSADPGLHLVVDGERIDARTIEGEVHIFDLARPPRAALRLCSHSAVPSLIGLSRNDHRRLGVAIGRVVLEHVGILTCFEHDAPQLREGGCHPSDDGYCWTDGELELPARFFTLLNGPARLIVETKHSLIRYPIAAPTVRAA